MKFNHRAFSCASTVLVLLFLMLGCGEIKSGPDWVKSKKIAGKEQKLSHISNIVVDDKFAYVVIGGTVADANEGTNGLRKVALDTGAVTSLDDGTKMPQSENGGLAIDEKYLYWNAGGNILRILKEGGKAEVVAAENVGIGIDMVVDGERVYWANHGYYSSGVLPQPKPIFSVLKTGGKSEVFADEQRIPHSLAIDDKFVYWHTSSSLMKKARAGGTPEPVYQIGDREGLDELSVDASSLYFGYRSPGDSRWALRKLAKTGGEPVTLVKSFSLKPFVIDDANVYFFDDESMYKEAFCKVPKNGGEVTRLDIGYSSGAIAQSKTQVYFGGGDDIWSFQK
ncbi:MAG: hypothetical protein KBF83_01180 [Pyrinomonadaceae bacterium]|nr:hypothetical protein [Pyrinomonadaceae bacterium]MBP9108145.1 hypothetical protein [Pyrinomonadaceae bacterium]